MRTKAPFILIFCLLLAGCATAPGNILLEPAPLELTPGDLSKPLVTKCRTDHQGFHEVTTSKAYVNNKDESLLVTFPPQLPAYWLGMELLLKDGSFQARPYGTPFSPGKVSFEVTKQELILRDSPITPGLTVNGCASINFTQHGPDGASAPYFFTGCFSARIHPEGGSASLTDEGLKFLAEQELTAARYELGQPIHDEIFTAARADKFRRSVLGTSISDRTEVRELTWDASAAAGLGGKGKKRLSVWYARQGDQWFPIARRIWQSGDVAYPRGLDGLGN